MTNPAARDARDRFLLAAVLAVIAGLFLARLGAAGYGDPDEGRYGAVAAAMVRSGDLVVPRLCGVPYLEKPPMLYWLTAASFGTLGVSETTGRLVPALAALAAAAVTAWIGRRVFGTAVGIAASAILALSPEWFALGRLLTTDMVLAFFQTAALASFLAAERTGRRGGYLAFWALLAPATLTKGPVGALLPVAIVALYVVLTKQWRLLREIRLVPGGLLLLALSVPWFLAVQARYPEFLRFFVVDQHLARFGGSEAEHAEAFWYFVPVFVIGFFPWIFLLPAVLARGAARDPGPRRARFFLAIWFAVIFSFFSVSKGKLATYILPAFPPVALLVAEVAAKWAARETSRATRWFSAGMWAVVVGLASSCGAFALLVPDWVRRDATVPWEDARGVAAALTAAFGLGALALGIALVGNRRKSALVSVAATMAVVLQLAVSAWAAVGPHVDARPLALALKERAGADDRLLLYRTLRPSVEFYTGRLPHIVGRIGELRFGVLLSGDMTRFRPDLIDARALLDGPGRVYALVERQDAAELQLIAGRELPVVASNAKLLLLQGGRAAAR